MLKEINPCRNLLFREKLIGINNDGIGYGNISIRHTAKSFIITGSGTGKIEQLSYAHYAIVTGYDIDANALTAQGPVIASSESLTHAMIYELQNDVNAVIHVHHSALWRCLLDVLPYSAMDVEYGTPLWQKRSGACLIKPILINKKYLQWLGMKAELLHLAVTATKHFQY